MRIMRTPSVLIPVLATIALIMSPGYGSGATIAAQLRQGANSYLHSGRQTADLTGRSYFLIDLGTLGGTQGVAEGVSNRGWVVGDANFLGDKSGHAFVWRKSVMTDLGSLGGPNSQEQWPVKDDRGLIVGSAETAVKDPFNEDFCGFDANSGVPPTGLICKAFLWHDGVIVGLPSLGGNNSQALGINNRGQAVGFAETGRPDPRCAPPQVLGVQAVIWGPLAGEIHPLPSLPGDASAWATGINDRGQIVGVSGNCVSPNFNGNGGVSPKQSVIWQDGKVTRLANLVGATSTFPWAINSRGQVAGQSTDASGLLHTFLWQNGITVDLGVIPGDLQSGAFGLNNRGDVVGGSCGPAVTIAFGCRGFVWRHGVMIDINGLIKSGSTSLYVVFGNDINDRGEVAAYAFDTVDGSFHAALAIPCAEAPGNVVACETGSPASAILGRKVRPTLSANALQQAWRRLRFGRLAAGLLRGY